MTTRFHFLFMVPWLLASGCLSGLTVQESPDGGGDTGGGSAGGGSAGGVCGNGFACIGEIPNGWEGYYRLQLLPTDQPPPSCLDGSTGLIYYGSPAATTECQCECTFTGALCSAPKVECFWSAGCPGTPDYSTQSADETCIADMPGATATSSCRIVASPYVTAEGTCSVTGGNVSNPPFAEQYVLCPAQFDKPCGNGGKCLLTDLETFDTSVCLIRDGSDACPDGFTTETQVYASGTDTRACVGCACSNKTITCSGGSYLVHDGDSCSGVSKEIKVLNQCVDVGTYLDTSTGSLRPKLGTPSNGACGGATGTGSIIPEGPRKLCCMKLH